MLRLFWPEDSTVSHQINAALTALPVPIIGFYLLLLLYLANGS